MPKQPRKEIGLSHLRVTLGDQFYVGPGRADLLELIGETGSISEAAKRMGMSYKRAWSLIEEMNVDFGTPLVHTTKGGKSYGGAGLTPTGKKILTLYRRIEDKAGDAIRSELKALRKLLPDIAD